MYRTHSDLNFPPKQKGRHIAMISIVFKYMVDSTVSCIQLRPILIGLELAPPDAKKNVKTTIRRAKI